MPASDVDQIAAHLGDWGARAHALPTSFQAGDCYPLLSSDGKRIGRVLPGVGVSLDCDLTAVGITRPIPHVYERSMVERSLDLIEAHARQELKWMKRLVHDTRGAITTFDGILAAASAGKKNVVTATKNTFTTSATVWYSTLRAGGNPGSMIYSGTPGTAPNNATAGALSNGLLNPSGGDTKYLTSLGFGSSATINMALVVDVLVVVGSLSATSASLQTVNSTPLTRYTSGAGVMAALEVTTALGAGAATITGTYTNQSAVGSRTFTSVAMSPSAIVQRLLPAAQSPQLPLQSGDYGIQSVQDVTLSASMTGSGVFALILYKELAWMPGVAANIFVQQPLAATIDGFQVLETTGGGALGCIGLFILPSATSSGEIVLNINTVAG